MILFRCWYCNRALARPGANAGTRFVCACGHRAKVPRRSGGSSKVRSPLDWVVETIVYGGCGAALGFGLGVMVTTRLPFFRRSPELVAGLTLTGLVAGTLFGENGLNWVGRRIRDRETS